MALALRFGLAIAGAFWCYAPSPQEQEIFRARVDLVQIDVVVTDRNGDPVEGLTAADFSLAEEGRPQEIVQFAAYDMPLGDGDVDTDRTLPPRDVFDNAVGVSPRVIAIVIDSLHLSPRPEDLARLERALRDVIGGITADDHVAIVFTNRSDLSVPMTRDRARLLRAVDNVRAAAAANARPGGGMAANARSAFWTVRNVVRVLAASGHARKVVFYVSDGAAAALQRRSFDEVLLTIEAAIRGGVVLYGIDPRWMRGSAIDQGIGSPCGRCPG